MQGRKKLPILNHKGVALTVATAYPNTPTRIAGTTNDLHPLALAIPAAVVGPPTFALLASNSWFHQRDSLKGAPFSRPSKKLYVRRPMKRTIARCAPTCRRVVSFQDTIA